MYRLALHFGAKRTRGTDVIARSIRGLRRAGRANVGLVLVVISAAAVTLLVFALIMLGRTGGQTRGQALTLFCAAGLRPPVEEIVADYAKQYGVSIQVQYGGSNTLLGQIEAGGVGDLYLAGDDTYARLAQQKGLARETIPVALMRPVVAVSRGNPKAVARVEDLLRPDLRVALGNPDQTAIGQTTRELLEKSGHWARLSQHVTDSGVFKPTVTDLANDLKIGSVDAAIVWDATVNQYPELEAVRLSALEEGAADITLCVLASAKAPTAALRFGRYLAARDRGLPVFASMGYEPVDGDVWAEVPELTFFVGSVNRRAVEETIKEFQAREGVVVNTVYNGCGILTAQMRTIRDKQSSGFPDTYMACDVYYLDTVKEWFQEGVNISETEIVMVVQEGNPKNIQALADLLRPDMRVVVGQPDQCTIGVLSRRLLEQEGIYDAVLKNVVSQTASSAMLVPAITTRSADIALAYATDAKAEAGRVDAVRIDSPHTKAIQPFAVARSSDQKYLGRRLFQAIAASREQFESAGFGWRLEGAGQNDPMASTTSSDGDSTFGRTP